MTERPTLLTEAERVEALARLMGWHVTGDGSAIAKSFVFGTFSEAFGWMTRVALAAERQGHHPDWRNSHRTVEVALSTHDAGGLTRLDIALAEAMDRLASPVSYGAGAPR